MEAGSASGSVVIATSRRFRGRAPLARCLRRVEEGWPQRRRRAESDGLATADDVEVTRRAIDAQSAPVTLVGHSYGGVVITEAGTHPKVAALVYIAAFAPDAGESVNTLIADPPPGAPAPPILPPKTGFCSSTAKSSILHSQAT